MNYYNASGQMDLSDRIAIETGICIRVIQKIAKDFADIHLLLHMKLLKKTEPSLKVITRMEKDCRMARQCTDKEFVRL